MSCFSAMCRNFNYDNICGIINSCYMLCNCNRSCRINRRNNGTSITRHQSIDSPTFIYIPSDKDLMELTYANCSPHMPSIVKAKVVKVYDGDTVHLGVKLVSGERVRYPCRIFGIDAPEMRSKNAEEKEIAIVSRNSLDKLIGNKIVLVNVLGKEKYGRVLASLRIMVNGIYIDISEYMINNKLAVPYNGGTKQEVNWKEYYFGEGHKK